MRLPAASHLRAGALMAVGAFVVHQLRYRLAFGEHAHDALAQHGHGYLDSAPLVLGVLVAVALGVFLRRLAVARRIGAGERSARGVCSCGQQQAPA